MRSSVHKSYHLPYCIRVDSHVRKLKPDFWLFLILASTHFPARESNLPDLGQIYTLQKASLTPEALHH